MPHGTDFADTPGRKSRRGHDIGLCGIILEPALTLRSDSSALSLTEPASK
jgi:hypothetical protein